MLARASRLGPSCLWKGEGGPKAPPGGIHVFGRTWSHANQEGCSRLGRIKKKRLGARPDPLGGTGVLL